MNGNKFATGQILQKPVEVVKEWILAAWAQKSPEPCWAMKGGFFFFFFLTRWPACHLPLTPWHMHAHLMKALVTWKGVGTSLVF
jgi:hypothetical protein